MFPRQQHVQCSGCRMDLRVFVAIGCHCRRLSNYVTPSQGMHERPKGNPKTVYDVEEMVIDPMVK